jgi:hypothetical protein
MRRKFQKQQKQQKQQQTQSRPINSQITTVSTLGNDVTTSAKMVTGEAHSNSMSGIPSVDGVKNAIMSNGDGAGFYVGSDSKDFALIRNSGVIGNHGFAVNTITTAAGNCIKEKTNTLQSLNQQVSSVRSAVTTANGSGSQSRVPLREQQGVLSQATSKSKKGMRSSQSRFSI